jgi:hypothetical protein
MEYLGLDAEAMLARPMPATTPYILYADVVREMMSFVADREDALFERFFLLDRRLTEFFLYFGYLHLTQRDPEQLYSFGKRIAVTLFTRWPEREEDIAKALGHLASPQYRLFGLHRNRTATLSPEHRALVIRFWQEAGLVASAAEAESILTA